MNTADWLNVKTGYGAMGDGTCDDTAAIQAALDAAAGGGTVYLAAGTYTITAPLTINSNTLLTGAGTSPVIWGVTHVTADSLAPGTVTVLDASA